MVVSVVIATRNRADRLRQALDSLERMSPPNMFSWELIVVDNGSTDGTREVVNDCEARMILPLRYLIELRHGKSAALNAGVRAATGDVVAFTDDDCVMSPEWLTAIAIEFDNNPSVAAIGGRVELYDAKDQPYTIRTQTTREAYAPLKMTALIVGCNMAFRREVLSAVGAFDESLGPGSRCRAAEDFDLLYRAHLRGLSIVYVPEVLVYHNHGRRTEADVRHLYAAYGVSMGAFYGKYLLRGDLTIGRMVYRHVRSMLMDGFRRLVRPSSSGRLNQIRMRDLLSGARLQLAERWR
jgi:glycosyltransferase involved in cell wall biosynthesis